MCFLSLLRVPVELLEQQSVPVFVRTLFVAFLHFREYNLALLLVVSHFGVTSGTQLGVGRLELRIASV